MALQKPYILNKLDTIDSQLADVMYNVKFSGAAGDGTTDDTNAIKSAIQYAITNNKKGITFEKGKRYKITSPIINSMGTLKNFEVDFNYSCIYMSTKFAYNNGLIAFDFDRTLKDTTLIVKNGYFDGSGYPPDWTTSPPITGSGVIHADGARNYIVDNCHFNDWFMTSAIFSLYSDNIKISNCTGVNVGGMATTSAYDAAGDAIYIGYCGYYADGNNKEVNVLIENCNFRAYDVIVPGDTTPINSFHSGRCGIVCGEYATQLTPKNFTINNSYFYNYQRVFHIEFTRMVRLNVNNCNFDECGNIVLIAHDNTWESILFNGCNFVKNNDVRGFTNGLNHIIKTANDSLNDSPSYTKENVCKFDTCNFTGYISLVGGMRATDCIVDNCQIVSIHHYFYNCRIKAVNSKFKLNSNQVVSSIYNFDNCRVELGHLHDANSIYVLSTTSGTTESTLSKNSIINNSRFINATIYQNGGFVTSILNSEFTFDSNFILKTYSGVTINGLIDLSVNGIKTIENCKFTNNTGGILSLFVYTVPNTISDILITKNIINGFKIDISLGNSFRLKIHNNIFTLNSLGVTCFLKTYSGAGIVTNNYFWGLTSGELNLSAGSVSLNNYRLSDSSATAI